MAKNAGAYAELDYAFEGDSYLADLAVIVGNFDLAGFEVLTDKGPSGWPEVRFTGSRENIARLEQAYEDGENLLEA